MPRKMQMLVKMFCGLSCKKAAMLVCGGFSVLLLFSYMFAFNHGLPEDIIAANKQNVPQNRLFAGKDTKDMDELDQEVAEEERKATEYWDNFIKKHDFVPIGEIYDNCGRSNI